MQPRRAPGRRATTPIPSRGYTAYTGLAVLSGEGRAAGISPYLHRCTRQYADSKHGQEVCQTSLNSPAPPGTFDTELQSATNLSCQTHFLPPWHSCNTVHSSPLPSYTFMACFNGIAIENYTPFNRLKIGSSVNYQLTRCLAAEKCNANCCSLLI